MNHRTFEPFNSITNCVTISFAWHLLSQLPCLMNKTVFFPIGLYYQTNLQHDELVPLNTCNDL
jgi:hypothetical protein